MFCIAKAGASGKALKDTIAASISPPLFEPKRLATGRLMARFGISPHLASAIVEMARLGGRV